jgi:hypothetical protein
VASEARLSYNGAVLNQSGIMYSAVHYEPASVAVKGSSGAGTITSISNGDVDKFSSNFQLVKQSLWNKTVNITSHGEGISHLWTPTSSLDYSFPGYSQGSSGNFTYCVGPLGFNNTNTISASKIGQGTGSAVRSFMWAATNLPPSATCLLLDLYEIYEAIPESEAINILQVRPSEMDHDDHKILTKIMNSEDSHDLMHPEDIKTPKKSFLSKVSEVVSKIGRHIDFNKVIPLLVNSIV